MRSSPPVISWLYYGFCGFAPGVFWLWFFRHKDDLDPEPKRRLILVFALGCGAAYATLVTRPHLEWLASQSTPWVRHTVDAFLVTAVPEEVYKLFAILVGAYLHRDFDEPLDGIIYGVAAALGFASLENVLYIVAHQEAWVGVYRAFTAMLAHVTFTGGLGYFLGKAKFSRSPIATTAFALQGVALAVTLHGAYDVFLFLGSGFHLVSLLFLLPLGLVLLGLKIRWLRARSPEFHSDR